MDTSFILDFETIKDLNGEILSNAFFKYIKRVSKNRTPLIFTGIKTQEGEKVYWKGTITECAIPVSTFYTIKLPVSESDKNLMGAKITLQFMDNLISQFENHTEFLFKESVIEIKRENLKIKCAYKDIALSLEEDLKDYQELIEREEENPAQLVVDNSSNILNVFKELKTSKDASIYLDSESITLLKDTVLFRTENTETFEQGNTATPMYINMYLASMVLSILEYTTKVKIEVGQSNTILTGYDENDTPIVRNVSAVFESEDDVPSKEDMNSIIPETSDSQVLDLDLGTFLQEIEKQKNTISVFIGTKNWEAKLFKGDNGSASFKFESPENAVNSTNVIVNIGEEVANEEDNFTEFFVALPIDLLRNVFLDNLNLRILYNDDDSKAVVFEVGNSKILSGKLYN